MRVGSSFDIHNLKKGKMIVLGGINIPSPFKVEAVSDGDILLHTISEAIIGACGAGDLGEYFSAKHKNISSVVILKKALSIMQEKNYCIINIDTTIVVQKPYLKEYKALIKEKIAEICDIKLDCINIKATTFEKNVAKKYEH